MQTRNIYNHGENISRLYHILLQFSFTTSESKLHYYHQKVGIRVASQWTNNWRLRILENYDISRESLKYFELMVQWKIDLELKSSMKNVTGITASGQFPPQEVAWVPEFRVFWVAEYPSVCRVHTECPDWTKLWISACPTKWICQKCCVNRMIFVLKLLDNNRS